MKSKVLLAAAVMMVAAGCESDDNNVRDEDMRTTTRSTVGAGTTNVSQADRTFVNDAASGDLFEVQSSQLALQQQNLDANLRQIAQMMIDDHTKASQELQQIASRKGLPVSQQLAPQHQQMLNQLRNASSNDFASQYRQMQLQAHQEAVALFQRASQNLQDQDLRQYAQRTLPVLREHLDQVQQYRPGSSGMMQPGMDQGRPQPMSPTQRPSNGADDSSRDLPSSIEEEGAETNRPGR